MRQVAEKITALYSFKEFEKVTGILWRLKDISELKMIGLKLMPDTDGSYFPSATNKLYLNKFCKRNPGYHIVSDVHHSLSDMLGDDAKNWICRKMVNCCADLKSTRRYYLADGDGAIACELNEMICVNETNVIPFRRR